MGKAALPVPSLMETLSQIQTGFMWAGQTPPRWGTGVSAVGHTLRIAEPNLQEWARAPRASAKHLGPSHFWSVHILWVQKCLGLSGDFG